MSVPQVDIDGISTMDYKQLKQMYIDSRSYFTKKYNIPQITQELSKYYKLLRENKTKTDCPLEQSEVDLLEKMKKIRMEIITHDIEYQELHNLFIPKNNKDTILLEEIVFANPGSTCTKNSYGRARRRRTRRRSSYRHRRRTRKIKKISKVNGH